VALRSRDACARVLRKRCPSTRRRAQGMPGARCTHSLACEMLETHECSHHRLTGVTRHSLRNGFNGFLRALPGDRAFLPPSLADHGLPVKADIASANLTPASGRQDHTTSPSALARSSARRRVHRIPHPTFVTIAKRPSSKERGTALCAADLPLRSTTASAADWHDGQIKLHLASSKP
jgi:hypothetical protein